MLHSFVFVMCFLCGWRAGILVLTFLVVNMLHSGIAVRACCTILLSYGRPCLTYHRGTNMASTGCAHWLRSCWKSTKRSLQTIIRSPGASSKWLAFAIFAKSWNKCEAFNWPPNFLARWLGLLACLVFEVLISRGSADSFPRRPSTCSVRPRASATT